MRFFLIASFSLLLACCATSYGPKSFTGGYSSTQLDVDRFTVRFAGNALATREQVDDWALLRSAEIALENGYSYFLITDTHRDSETNTFRAPTNVTTTVDPLNPDPAPGANITSTVTGGHTSTSTKSSTAYTIECFTERPDGDSYDANFIRQSIRSKYDMTDSE